MLNLLIYKGKIERIKKKLEIDFKVIIKGIMLWIYLDINLYLKDKAKAQLLDSYKIFVRVSSLENKRFKIKIFKIYCFFKLHKILKKSKILMN
jgi:hypothetical protein